MTSITKRAIAVVVAGIAWTPALANEPFSLFTGKIDVSSKANLPLLDVPWTVIDAAREDEYQFTLGADIIVHDGALVAQWGNSLVDENDAGSIVRGSRSADGGKTWSEPEVIAPGYEGDPRHCHGVLHAADGELWCFVAQHGLGPKPGRYAGLRTEAFRYDDVAKTWTSHGTFGDQGFWPLGKPARMDNGKWIMAGAVVRKAANAAVAIHDGEGDWTQWRIVEIPHPAGDDPDDSAQTWGETAVIVEGRRVMALVRNQRGGGLLVSVSEDYGETWPALRESNLPTSASKPTAGTLRDGRHYLVATYLHEKRGDRNTLFLALTEPGELTFTRIARLLDKPSPPPRWPGSGKRPQWGYPSACEYDGKLYIVYSVSKEDTGLSIVDPAALR